MIPVGDEAVSRTRPYVNYALIAANCIVAAAMYATWFGRGPEAYETIIRQWGFTPDRFGVGLLFTSIFIHSGPIHLFGNMVYLAVFGDNIEDILGHAGYLAFYVAMGMLAGLGHYFHDPASAIPAIGASGAISGVLGAYIVLFTRSRVRVMLWWYFYIRFFWARAFWLLGFYFALQIFLALVVGGNSGVGYWAHIAGFACGVATVVPLILAKLIKRPDQSPERTLSLLYADGGRGPAGHDDAGQGRAASGPPDTDPRMETQWHAADGTHVMPGEVSPAERCEAVLATIADGKMEQAVEMALVEFHMMGARAADAGALARLADAFYREKVYPVAFEFYSAFIRKADPGDPRLPEVKLRAGMTASRHLRDYDGAKPLLMEAVGPHNTLSRRALASHELSAIEANLARVFVGDESALHSGPCAVIRHAGGTVNVPVVGRLVSQATGQPFADVTKLLRGSTGFVAADVDAVTAKGLAIRLSEMGIPVLVIPNDKLVLLPPARPVKWLSVDAAGISWQTGGAEGEGGTAAWAEVYCATAGLVSFVVDRNNSSYYAEVDDSITGLSALVGAEPPQPGYGGVETRSREVRVERQVMDIFTLSPFRCLRVIEGNLTFKGSAQGDTMSLHRNFCHLASAIIAHGRQVSTTEGVRLLAGDAPPGRWRAATFNSAADFERYNYWRLQLEQYG